MKELHFDKSKFTKNQVNDEIKGEAPGKLSETKNFHVFKQDIPVTHEKIKDGVVVKKLDTEKATSAMKTHVSGAIKDKVGDSLKSSDIEANVEKFALEMFLIVPDISQGLIAVILNLLKKIGIPDDKIIAATKRIEGIGDQLSANMIHTVTPMLMDLIKDFI